MTHGSNCLSGVAMTFGENSCPEGRDASIDIVDDEVADGKDNKDPKPIGCF